MISTVKQGCKEINGHFGWMSFEDQHLAADSKQVPYTAKLFKDSKFILIRFLIYI